MSLRLITMNSHPIKFWLLATASLLGCSLPWLFRVKAQTLPRSSEPTVATYSIGATKASYSVPDDDFQRVALPFLDKHCLRCHSGNDAEAGFDLAKFDSQSAVNADPESWKLITDALNDQYMPPADEVQPEAIQVQVLLDWYLKSLSQTGQHANVVPPMRRLNRIEYQNTISDLLRIRGDLFTNASQVLLVDEYFQPSTQKMPRYVMAMSHFAYLEKRPPLLPGLPDVPNDPPVEHGFSNDHTSLSFSPLQAERYIELANAILTSKSLPRISGMWEPLFLPSKSDTDLAQQKLTAESRLRSFLDRAFRRPATDTEVARYSDLFNDQLDMGRSHVQAMQTTVSAILISPSFLFRQDFSAGSFGKKSVDPYAMASRLSYFLWASMPDAELLQAAKEGRLNQPSGLVEEVRRMMRHERIKSLATDFGMQWLKVASVNSARPDRDLFPKFYDSKIHPTATSMIVEQLLFFETILVEDRNIMEFINADWGYLNRNLMDWYGQNPAEVLGYTPDREAYEDFFRIKWSNKHKGGVITAGATLVSTSATTRTSPVYRGAWILDVIFNKPPPPPPANVPALEAADKKAGHSLNVRERLQLHRADPNCAVCHNRMDPLGFALEKFDPVGRFRKSYPNADKIDATGSVFNEDFDGAARFKAVISHNERQFVQGFTEHLLKYALGRRLEVSDRKQVQQIVDAVIRRGKNFSAVVEEVVLSDLFRSPPTTVEPTNAVNPSAK